MLLVGFHPSQTLLFQVICEAEPAAWKRLCVFYSMSSGGMPSRKELEKNGPSRQLHGEEQASQVVGAGRRLEKFGRRVDPVPIRISNPDFLNAGTLDLFQSSIHTFAGTPFLVRLVGKGKLVVGRTRLPAHRHVNPPGAAVPDRLLHLAYRDVKLDG